MATLFNIVLLVGTLAGVYAETHNWMWVQVCFCTIVLLKTEWNR